MKKNSLPLAAVNRFTSAWMLLRIAYGLFFVIIGLDKFFNLLTQWKFYVSPFALRMGFHNVSLTLRIAGGCEILLGLMLLSGWIRSGSYALSLWCIFLLFNVLSMRMYYEHALVLSVLAAGAVALAWLSEVRNALHI